MNEMSSVKKYDFMGKSVIAFIFSAILIAGSFYIWFERGDNKFGIDYKGGHEIIVKVEGDIGSEDLRKALGAAKFEGLVVQSFDQGSGEYSLKIGDDAKADDVKKRVSSSLDAQYKDKYEIVKTDYVGPTIGKELRKKALIAVIVGLIGMLGYISFRFEFAFALGAVAALFHDVIVCMGIYLLCGFTISVATLAAALTIVGYSVNDTIIIFDRMREEIFKQKKFDLIDLMNYSISATLSRTMITSILTLFSALALLLFGGGAIAELSLFLVVGVILGTYSTVFIASPVALAWENFRTSRENS